MPAAKHKLKIEQGTSFRQPFYWKPGGVIADLAGFTARMHVRGKIEDPDPPLLSMTTENGKIEIDPVEGKITLVLEPEDTTGVSWRTGVYDLELIDSAGFVSRILYGSVTISPEVTR